MGEHKRPPINIGLKYRIGNFIDITASYVRGEKLLAPFLPITTLATPMDSFLKFMNLSFIERLSSMNLLVKEGLTMPSPLTMPMHFMNKDSGC